MVGAGLAKRKMRSCLRSCSRIMHGDGTCQACYMNVEIAGRAPCDTDIVNVLVVYLAALEEFYLLPPATT